MDGWKTWKMKFPIEETYFQGQTVSFRECKYYCWWQKSCTTCYTRNPMKHGIFSIPTGAGFLPSRVCSFFWAPVVQRKNLSFAFGCLAGSLHVRLVGLAGKVRPNSKSGESSMCRSSDIRYGYWIRKTWNIRRRCQKKKRNIFKHCNPSQSFLTSWPALRVKKMCSPQG